MIEDRSRRYRASEPARGLIEGERASIFQGVAAVLGGTWLGPLLAVGVLIGGPVAAYALWGSTAAGAGWVDAEFARHEQQAEAKAQYEATRRAQARDGLPAPLIAHETGVQHVYLLIDAKTGCQWFGTYQYGRSDGFTGMERRTERLADGTERQVCNPASAQGE